MDYLSCYQILQLDPDSDWAQARHHYRLLASRHHPDRPDHDPGDFSLTDINRAYRTLKEYYRTNGTMPLMRKASTNGAPFSRPERKFHFKRKFLLIGALIAAFYVGYQSHDESGALPGESVTVAPQPPLPVQAPPTEPSKPPPRIVSGDTLGRVVEVLGPPDDRNGQRWYYGNSWIEFRDGRVIDWYSSIDQPLPVDLLGQHGSDQP